MSLGSFFKKAANAVVKVAKEHPTETKLILAAAATKVAPKSLKPLVPVLLAAPTLPAILGVYPVRIRKST